MHRYTHINYAKKKNTVRVELFYLTARQEGLGQLQASTRTAFLKLWSSGSALVVLLD